MRNSERNWSPDHSTKWPQSMARLRPWFLGHGSKRSRLDEGPSSSNRTVNSRCSEFEAETQPNARRHFRVASAQQKEVELLPVELRRRRRLGRCQKSRQRATINGKILHLNRNS